MKLTEDIVFQRLRNCSSRLETITKINITGRDLDDISLLRRMTAIEVLSLSVNKISTLCDLQCCKFLKELYLRKNNISDLNEIYYLKNLPNLTILGLSQNPCSNSPSYRMTLIKNLPKLEKLDDIIISPEERLEAFRMGVAVVNPEEMKDPVKAITEDRPSSIEMATPLPDPKSEEVEISNHLPSRLGSPSKSVRMDNCSPDRTHLDVTMPEKPVSAGTAGHSNLLPGILVLVTDLDYYSLEILLVNIKNRLNEFQANGMAKPKQ